jgi:hypothetical protein
MYPDILPEMSDLLKLAVAGNNAAKRETRLGPSELEATESVGLAGGRKAPQ